MERVSQVKSLRFLARPPQNIPETSAPVAPTTPQRVHPRWHWLWVAATAMLAVAGIAVGWWEWWSMPAVPYVTGIEAITHDGLTKGLAVTDGSRVYFCEDEKGHLVLAQVSTTGGEISTIDTPLQVPWLRDIAPDKSSLLVSDIRSDSQPSPLWIVPVPAGAPRRVGNVFANAAAWTPDGNKIIFTKGREIWIAAADGSQMRKLWTAPNPSPPTWMLRVSPDGKRMRFDGCEQSGCALWEANTDGSDAHRLLPDWQEHSSQIPGAWSPDGRYYVFAVLPGVKERWVQGRWLVEEHWLLPERRGWFTHRRPAPVLLLARGPVVFDSPGTFSPDGRTLFVRGAENLAELVRYEAATHQTGPYLSGISATELAFSPDGQWVTYISVPDSSLWRSRMDGSGRVQLTSPGASIARWSPDGTRIAFEWAPPGRPGKLALISRDGGTPEQVIPDSEDSHSQTDPTWSPDGSEIIFARNLGQTGVERMELLRVDLRTRKVTPVLGSEGLYSPRWSPDGRYLAAFPVDQHGIRLFDFQKQEWTTWFTSNEGNVGWNLWSLDSKALYFVTDKAGHSAWWRIGLGERAPKRKIDLPQEQRFDNWLTLTPDGNALYTRDRGLTEIYALHLSEK